MRIAIIEKNVITRKKLKKSLKGHIEENGGSATLWEVDFYIDPEKFFEEKNTGAGYDLVLVDCDKGDQVCFDFIHKISNTSDAELCILTNNSDPNVLSSILNDDSITYILDKDDLNMVVSHLEYSSARKKIRQHLLNESAVYDEIKNEMF